MFKNIDWSLHRVAAANTLVVLYECLLLLARGIILGLAVIVTAVALLILMIRFLAIFAIVSIFGIGLYTIYAIYAENLKVAKRNQHKSGIK